MSESVNLEAVVVAAIRELRFPYAGVVESMRVKMGEMISANQVIASLRQDELKKKHQIKLENYHKTRATFEQLKTKLGQSDDPDKKYLLDRSQADLNISVLELEVVQLELDASILRCPFPGLVINDGGLAAGMTISPASFPIQVADLSTIRIQAEIDQADMPRVKRDYYAEFTPIALPEVVYKGRIVGFTPQPPDRRTTKFGVWGAIETTQNLLPGMIGKLEVFPDR